MTHSPRFYFLLFLAIIVATAYVYYPSYASATSPQPAITWSLQNISIHLSPGTPQIFKVDLQAARNLNNVSLSVQDSILSDFITITPRRFSSLRSGSITTITITFLVPTNRTENLHHFSSAIVPKIGNRNLAKSLPFAVTVSNDESIAGPDSNRNGVRDDIDAYINATYSDADTRKAATQYAKAVQQAIIDASNKEASLGHAGEISRASECMWSFHGEESDRILSALVARTLNNKARSLAYVTFNDQLAGGYFPGVLASQYRSSCVP